MTKPVKKKRKVGRKPRPIDPAQVEKMASQGLTKAQIAGVLGFGETYWYERERKEPEIAEAYKRGKSKGVLMISNALFEQARSGNLTAQIFYLKCMGGWRDNKRIELSGPEGGPIKHESKDARETLLEKLTQELESEKKK
jgi:hypothetical protein